MLTDIIRKNELYGVIIMINGLGITLSALEAHRKKMDVTANNVANINTDGFKKSRVLFKEEEGSRGVQVDIRKVETPGSAVLYDDGERQTYVETSNVDYAEEAVNMIMARRGFEANLKALQAQDEMLGSLLNIKI